MNYEDIKKAYDDNPELALMDAVDMLSRDPSSAGEILNYVASLPNTEKNVVTLPPMNPTEPTFSQDIQLLSTDWEPQYKSQGDSISISLNDSDEEQMLELSCQGPDTYPVPLDVGPLTEIHLNTTID